MPPTTMLQAVSDRVPSFDELDETALAITRPIEAAEYVQMSLSRLEEHDASATLRVRHITS